jgi:hypothetical protein
VTLLTSCRMGDQANSDGGMPTRVVSRIDLVRVAVARLYRCAHQPQYVSDVRCDGVGASMASRHLDNTADHPAKADVPAASTALSSRRRSSADVLPTTCSSFLLLRVVITKGCDCSKGVARMTSSRSQLLP